MLLRISSFLLFLVSPVSGFLLSLPKLKKWFGGVMFLLFAVFFNLCFIFRPQDDIYRYVQGYNFCLSQDGDFLLNPVHLYYSWSSILFASHGASAIIIYVAWTLVYYLGMYLCLRCLLRFCRPDVLSLTFLLGAFFFINPFQFTTLSFYTAAYWFIFLAVSAEMNERPWWYVALLWGCVLIHYAYTFVVLLYFLYRLWRPSARTLTIIWLVTWLLSFVDISSVFQSMGIAGSAYYFGERTAEMYASYGYGRYLYAPMQWLILYYLYVQYRHRHQLSLLNKRLLGLAIFMFVLLNLVASSWDFTLRLRTIAEWVGIVSVACYYYETRDRHCMWFAIVFPVAFIFSNWDFLFVSGPDVIDYAKILTSNLWKAWADCSYVLERINY